MSLLKKLKNVLFPEPAKIGELPPWVRRLQKAEYTSPKGTRVPFQYVDITSFFEKKTSSFGSATTDGVFVQDNGVGGNRFPLACYFSGASHDLEASTMMKALLEKGEGVLNHPIWGVINVVPNGEIEHISNLATAGGQTIVMVDFFETTGLQIGGLPAFGSLLDQFNSASAFAFADKLKIDNIADKKNFVQTFMGQVGKASEAMKNASKAIAGMQASIDDFYDSIDRGIDTLVGQPLMLARQVQIMIGEPARRRQLTKAKLAGYKNMASDIFGTKDKSNGFDNSGANSFRGNKLIAQSAIAQSAVSVIDNDFVTAQQAIEAAQSINNLLDSLTTWSDDTYLETDIDQDTGDGDLELSQLVTSSISQLVTQATTALRQVRITLPYDRGLQELCFELTGSSKPDALDSFRNLNNIGGNEMFMIPKGREIVYYI